jgi:hypothetical protein
MSCHRKCRVIFPMKDAVTEYAGRIGSLEVLKLLP